MSDPQRVRPLDAFDMILLLVFLTGLYLQFDFHITAKIPIPSPPAGIAGLILLWRRRDRIEPWSFVALLGVFSIYLASIAFATNPGFLTKRFTGAVQLIYSLTIAYAFFLTLIEGEPRRIARLFLGFCIAMLIGAALEDYGGLRAISDAVRLRIFDYGIYDADLRDMALYGRIRPKLFTSEPSSLTFAFTLFSFAWLMTSPWRGKVLVYLALMAAGLFVMPGPTLLLMLALLGPYALFAKSRVAILGDWQTRLVAVGIVGALLAGAFFAVGDSLYAARLNQLDRGEDTSFYFREIAPMKIAGEVVRRYPFAGIGLTGEPFIATDVQETYEQSPAFQADWSVAKTSDMLTNYFWLHWIYLGLFWGGLAAAALVLWLRQLGAPSVIYCFAVWSILGQAAGDYVGPRTWAVLLIAAAGMILQRRSASDPAPSRTMRLPMRVRVPIWASSDRAF